jgi:CDP-diglyceride synthetase
MTGRPMTGIGKRSAVGAVGAAILMIAVAGPPPAALVIFTTLFFFGILEASAMVLRLGGHRILIFASLILYLLAVSPGTISVGGAAMIGGAITLLTLAAIRHAGFLARLFPFLVAAGFAAGYLLKLRAGGSVLLAVFLATWASDCGAYFIGLRFGRRLLAPLISPGKTWEGAAGGFAGALIVGLIMGWLLDRILFGALLGFSAGTLGQIGDLAESRLKRLVGVKDSGALFPGHGGVLDRFDAFFVNAAVALLLWTLV